MLEEHKEGHAKLAALLEEREVIFAKDVEGIFGKRPWISRADEILQDEQEQMSKGSSNADDKDSSNEESSESKQDKEDKQ